VYSLYAKGKLMYAGVGKLVGLDEDFRFDNIGDSTYEHFLVSFTQAR
jgi:dolichyl-phosphate-mannose--protein O-mannosyl transferase